MTKYNLPNNWPAPNQHLIELGRIMALWGILESNVNLAISKLAGYEAIMDWRAAILTAHSNFNQRIDILATLCDELQKDFTHLSEYKTVISQIRNVQSKRNRYAHNSIFLNEESNKVETASMKARGKLTTKIEEVTIDDLKQVSAEIHMSMLALHKLITQKEYPPIWEKR